jgi:HEAT repeat protein
MATHPALTQFFRAILTARRSLNLYPDGSKQASSWAPRFRRALTDAVDRGLAFPVVVGRDRFTWLGGEMKTTDVTMEALRFDLQSRGIASLYIDAAVVEWELRVFLELLSMPPDQHSSVFGASAYLRSRGVIGISVGAPALTEAPDYDIREGGTLSDDSDANANSVLVPMNSLDTFAESISASIEDYFKDLVYDQSRLADWFTAISASGGLDAFYGGVRMLGEKSENSSDRELRLRTILEAIFQLPHTIFAPLVADRLIPMSPYDLVAFNLLTQVTEEELRLITRYVPQEKLMTLSTDLVEFTWETGKRQRLVEAVTWSLQKSGNPEEQIYSVPLSPDDPFLLELREEIITSCNRKELLDRSIDILLALVFDEESMDQNVRPVKALAEAMHEALSLSMPELCLRILREVIVRTTEAPALPGLEKTVAELMHRAADPALVRLIAEPLRQTRSPEQVEMAVEYLRLIGEEGIEAFTELLGVENDRRVRTRMCEVLTRVGASAISILGGHVSDPRWYLARNAVNILGKSRQLGAAAAVTTAFEHPHPRVRLEAIRAALLIDSPGAMELILGRINDPDPSVRRAVINAISRKGIAGNVSALRRLVLSPIQDQDDLEIKIEAVDALVSIGTSSARSVLVELADLQAGFWARAPRRLKGLAREALGRMMPVESLSRGELLER